MGKVVEREQDNLKNMLEYCARTIALAVKAERTLGALVDHPRVTVIISTMIRVQVDGEEDDFVDQVRRLIRPGLWERGFSDYSGQFEFGTEVGGIHWSVVPTAGVRGCSIRKIQRTLDVTRYESVCGDEAQA